MVGANRFKYRFYNYLSSMIIYLSSTALGMTQGRMIYCRFGFHLFIDGDLL